MKTFKAQLARAYVQRRFPVLDRPYHATPAAAVYQGVVELLADGLANYGPTHFANSFGFSDDSVLHVQWHRGVHGYQWTIKTHTP